jgi:hypothetical protein
MHIAVNPALSILSVMLGYIKVRGLVLLSDIKCTNNSQNSPSFNVIPFWSSGRVSGVPPRKRRTASMTSTYRYSFAPLNNSPTVLSSPPINHSYCPGSDGDALYLMSIPLIVLPASLIGSNLGFLALSA